MYLENMEQMKSTNGLQKPGCGMGESCCTPGACSTRAHSTPAPGGQAAAALTEEIKAFCWQQQAFKKAIFFEGTKCSKLLFRCEASGVKQSLPAIEEVR